MNARYRQSRSGRRHRRKRWWELDLIRKVLSRSLAAIAICLAISGAGYVIFLLMPEPDDRQLIDRALESKQDGDLNAAVTDLKAVLLRDPNNLEARWLLSEVYLSQRDGAAALEQVERAIELGRHSREATYRVIEALLMDQQFDRALAQLAFLETSGQDPTIYILRGQARLGLNRPHQAREAFQKALQVAPGNSLALIGMATAAFALGDTDSALELIESGLQKDPKSYLGWMLRGEIAMHQHDGPAAQAAFEKALRLSGNDIVARLALVQSLLVQKKFDQANVHLGALLKKNRENPSLQFLIAQRELTKNSNFDAAEEALQAALKESPEDTSTLLLMGWLKLMKGETETALQHLNAYHVLLPGEPTGSKLLANILLRKGELPRAIEVLQRAAEESPKDVELLAMLGNAYLQAGDSEKAKALFSKAVAASPEAATIRTQLALSLLATGDMERGMSQLEAAVGADPTYLRAEFLLALLHYQTGDDEAALTLASGLAQKHPEAPLPYILMAAIREDRGDTDGARDFYRKSLEIAPDNLLARYNLARLSKESGDLETARERFQSVLLLEPGHLPSIIALAQIEMDDNGWEKALALLEQALEEHPESLGLRLELSSMYLRMSKSNKALELAQEATEIAPYHPGARLALGRAQMSTGQAAAARETLERVVAQSPESAVAHFELSKAQLKMKDIDGARAIIEKASKLAPGNVDIKEAKGRIYLLQGEHDAAQKIAIEMQQENPDSPEGYMLQGDILMVQQKTRAALSAYESGRSLSGSRGSVMKLQAAHRLIGDNTSADLVLRDWLSEHPVDVQARVTLATGLVEAGELEAAGIELSHALKYQPNDGILHNNLAWIYDQTGDTRAIDHAQRAFGLLPDNPDVLDTYGWLVARNEDPHRGLALLESAIDLAPDNPRTRYHLAGALALTGQQYRAIRELESILKSPQKVIDRQVLEQAIADLEQPR